MKFSRATFSASSFPSNSPRVQCLRICAYVLRHAITTNVDSPGKFSFTSCLSVTTLRFAGDRVGLINSAFRAYNTVAKSFGEIMQEELRTVGISLYGGACEYFFF